MLRGLLFFLFIQMPLFAEDKPLLPPSFDFWASFKQMGFSLVLVVGLIVITGFVLKRFMSARLEATNASSRIKILESRVLTPKSTVYLLDVDGKSVLIAESQTGVHMLTELHIKEAAKASFADVYQATKLDN